MGTGEELSGPRTAAGDAASRRAKDEDEAVIASSRTRSAGVPGDVALSSLARRAAVVDEKDPVTGLTDLSLACPSGNSSQSSLRCSRGDSLCS